jgi:hypothetical protein
VARSRTLFTSGLFAWNALSLTEWNDPYFKIWMFSICGVYLGVRQPTHAYPAGGSAAHSP